MRKANRKLRNLARVHQSRRKAAALENSYPLRISGEVIAKDTAGLHGGFSTVGGIKRIGRVAARDRLEAIGIVAAISIQIDVGSELIGAIQPIGQEDRRTREIKLVGDVLQGVVAGERISC